MRIVIIGSGNVANIFAKRLYKKDVKIAQIIARNIVSGEKLAKEVGADSQYSFSKIDRKADAYIIAVQDSALAEVVTQLQNNIPKNALLVHTTGSASIEILKNISLQYGMIYPLQSLRKENAAIKKIPLFLDANNKDSLKKLKKIAKKISSKIALANDYQRIRLHIAAVLVSNFPNYLFSMGEKFCQQNNLEFSFLLPLIEETVHRLKHFSPQTMQTGPAARKDFITIEKHKNILENEFPDFLQLYTFLTQQIIEGK